MQELPFYALPAKIYSCASQYLHICQSIVYDIYASHICIANYKNYTASVHKSGELLHTLGVFVARDYIATRVV